MAEVNATPEVKAVQAKPVQASNPAAVQAKPAQASNPAAVQPGQRPDGKSFQKARQMSSRGPRRGERRLRNDEGLDKKIVSIRRVARTYSGGKRMRLSVLVVAGDKAGRVGVGLGKGDDVRKAEEKAFNRAKKSLVKINLKGVTIPHEITHKKGAAKIFMKPAAPGTGVIAGSALRAVLELVGVKDILTKILGTNNSISNVYAAMEALQKLKPVRKNVTPVS
jgi:small subunit ribosomal protein S5